MSMTENEMQPVEIDLNTQKLMVLCEIANVAMDQFMKIEKTISLQRARELAMEARSRIQSAYDAVGCGQ